MDEEIPYNELLLDVEDGIVVGLYHYLWLKNGKGHPCPEVNIPHTIIISNGRPKVWYFTSGKEHCIKRKNRANITNATITEALAPRLKTNATTTAETRSYTSTNRGNTIPGNGGGGGAFAADPSAALLGAWGTSSHALGFSQPQQQSQPQQGQGQAHRRNKAADGGTADGGRAPDGTCTGTNLGPWPHHGVVARFQGSMTMPNSAGGVSNRGASLGRKKKGAQFELQDESVEFFTREQLAEILPPGHAVVHGVAALHEGVLQRFVQPRGQNHFSIRATWSPNACVVERRTCKAKLNDPRVALAERLAAWDGPNWLSDHQLITGTVLHGSICKLCDNVASHLGEVSGGGIRVLRMVLFFCVDEANRIWFTHCGTLKTERLMMREHAIAAGCSSRFGGGAGGGSGHHLQNVPVRLRALVPSTSLAALRLRSPDGSPGGAGLSGEASLDLPAPNAAFVASKAAAATATEGAGEATAGRFLCVLTGEMYPATQRCDMTYKQLLQHWFSLASQLPNEGDRLRAMDTIPLAIRRANPSLTREWYLRVRSQPTFLYRTASVCLEAAAQITGMAVEDLQRTLLPTPSGMGVVAAAAAAAVGGSVAGTAWPSPGGAGGGGSSGIGLLAGWTAGGSVMAQAQSSPRGPAADGLSRQNTASTARVQLAAPAAIQQRPATALPPAGPSSHSLHQQQQQHQPVPSRSGSRQQLPPAQQHMHPHSQSGGGPSRHFLSRSKSASPIVAASRLALAPTSSVGGGGGGGLPSMLIPRDRSPGGGAGGAGLAGVPSFLQVYGPTPEQAAEAAAIAAALPYEVLDEARQVVDDEMTAETRVGATEADSPRGNRHAHDEDGDGDGRSGRGGDGSGGAADGLRNASHGDGGPPAGTSAPTRTAHGAAAGDGISCAAGAPGSPGRGRGPGLGYAAAAATAAHGGGGGYAAPRPSRLPGRMSTSSEVTEMGSVASFSDPSSPSGTYAGFSNSQSHVYAHPPQLAGSGSAAIAGGGGPPAAMVAPRMSPPRSAGAPTLHTIHEEGAAAASPPPLPPSSATRRSGSPLAGPDLLFPPQSRGGSGSHSVPRMRPTTRNGLDRQHAPGLGVSVAGRRHPGPGAAAAGAQRHNSSFSESGDLPVLSGAAAASLNSTMASSIGSLSRRSTSNQAVLSSEDMRTLRELNEAYTAAERLTQQLLAQAHEILSEDGGSRPGSTGTSPMHGGRRQQASPRLLTPTISRPGTGNSGLSAAGGATRQPSASASSTSTGGGGGGGSRLMRLSSGSGRPGKGAQRPSSPSLQPAPAPMAAPAGLGPSPLGGQQEPSFNRTDSGQALGSAEAAGDAAASRAASLTQAQASAAAIPPALTRVSSSCSGAGSAMAEEPPDGGANDAGLLAGAAAAAAEGSLPRPTPTNLDLLTSAEADLLAEALQE